MSQLVNSRDRANFTALFTRSGKAGGLQIPVFHGIFDPRCRGFAVDDYGPFRRGSEALRRFYTNV